ncbi:hybrid sensor histidine kinase/response regulator [uncultured Draconibacterium sp.]|uniref:hybrid sensor histidine kinase/response regulator n=1 Tax=uncultured Draconibacterium sp. TaxID=1573823 RepID=UPI002AA7E9BC|nr:hybrid sensor histidine kinase/response regulator [uncultured Draconibacterium sp.]
MQTKKPVILIVDDVPKNIQVLGTLLAKFKCELAVAMNGQQALDTVEKVKPDLILLDVMMPIMDGHETCRRLKSNESTKDIPVIFLSAKTETEDIVEGFKLGAVDYVTKPFIGKELVARVQTHLTLRQTQQTLSEEVHSKNKFFSIMSHDLRGAFGIITNFVQLIQEGGDFLTNEEKDELLNDIQTTSTNTLELLENLLKWARSQTGAIKFSPENLKLTCLFDEIQRNHTSIAQAKDISILNSERDELAVYGDRNMILLIIRNLVSNAIKFTNKGGQISLIAQKADDNMIKVVVADTGVGISPDKVGQLFSIESKTTSNGTANEQGHGLGLVLCKEFVKINNGDIGIISEPDKGTQVWFTLPSNKPEE